MLARTDKPVIQPAYDQGLAWAVLLLLMLGLVMVYSASIATAEAARYTGHHSAYFLVRQGFAIVLGLIAAAAAFQVPVDT